MEDAELKYTNNDVPVVNVSIIHNEGPQGTKGDKSHRFDIQAWDHIAENAFEEGLLTQGSLLIIIGKLKQNSWVSADGTRNSRTIIVANYINKYR